MIGSEVQGNRYERNEILPVHYYIDVAGVCPVART